MDPQPQLSADALLEQLRGQFETLCRQVADAVNQAPAGQVINASEEKVRDLLAGFRRDTYQAAVQLRLQAAEAAFPPPAPPRHPITATGPPATWPGPPRSASPANCSAKGWRPRAGQSTRPPRPAGC